MKFLSIVLLSLALIGAARAACTEDWQCGNPVYFDCSAVQDCNILPGVATAPGEVYWLERCNTGNDSTVVYVVRANEDGVQRVKTVSEAQAKYLSILDGNDEAIYFLRKPEIYAGVTSFAKVGDELSDEISVYQLREPNTFDMAFNEQGEQTFFCWRPFYFVVTRYNTLNVTSSMASATTYTETTCDSLAYSSGEIFWTFTALNSQQIRETRFIRANASCDNCSPPPYFTAVAGYVVDFEVANGRLYYAIENEGVKSVDVNAPDFANAQVLVAAGVNVGALKIRNNRLYYNDGAEIKAINLDGSNAATISPPIVTENRCVCSGGFSGANCDECPEGQVQWENGQASCVRIASSGWPISCSADYHCGNIPYTRCNEQRVCECVSGGIPTSCTECVFGHIEWNNGIPSCVV